MRGSSSNPSHLLLLETGFIAFTKRIGKAISHLLLISILPAPFNSPAIESSVFVTRQDQLIEIEQEVANDF